MDVPAGAVLEGDALEEDVFTFAERHHDRAEEGLDELLVELVGGLVQRAGGHAGLLVTLVRIPGAAIVGKHAAFFDDVLPHVVPHLAAFDLAPGVSVAVDDALAGDGDVMGALGMDRGEAAADVEALEVGVDDRVEVLVRREHEHGALFEAQLDVALEADRSAQPESLRDNDRAAPLPCEVVDGLCNGVAAERHAVGDSAEIDDGDAPGRDVGALEDGHVEGKAFIESGELRGLF